MPHSVDPKQTTRAFAYEFWMKAPNPMVTFIKTIDVTRLVRISKREGLKFNMLLIYSPLSSTRNKRAWVDRGSSPTSSKKMVPPLASAK